ncbi:MAG: ImuA family protein [Pirellulaceae bacterium]
MAAAPEPVPALVLGSRQEMVAALRDQIRQLGSASRSDESAGSSARPSNCPGLERLLPQGRFPAGSLVEWLSEWEAGGAGTLAWLAAQAAAGIHPAASHAAVPERGVIVVLDRHRSFYPPAAVAWGARVEQLIVVRATRWDDELWACDQALRCAGVAAVWGRIERLPSRWFRRLQLAAEQGRAIAHLLRPARVRGSPSWAYAQFWVEPIPFSEGTPLPERASVAGRRWRVELTRCHGGSKDGPGCAPRRVEVELDLGTGAIRERIHETHVVHLVPPLASAAPVGREAGT